MTTQPTSIDEIVDFIEWLDLPPGQKRELRTKLTTLVEQAKQEGRDMACDYISANTGLEQAMSNLDGYSIVTDKVIFTARTISSDKK